MPEQIAPNQDPAFTERLARWDALDQEMNRAARSMYGGGIESGINDTAVGINAVFGGYYTYMSCEGHEDEAWSFPWISFSPAWQPDQREAQLDGLNQLLNDFYAARDTESDLHLGIYDGKTLGGASYTLMSVVGHELAEKDSEELRVRNHESLEKQQREITDLATFLKEKFLDGFQIELPPEDPKEAYDEDNDWENMSLPSDWSYEISQRLFHLNEEKFRFDPETLKALEEMEFEEAFETAYRYLESAGLDADTILAPWIDEEDQEDSTPV